MWGTYFYTKNIEAFPFVYLQSSIICILHANIVRIHIKQTDRIQYCKKNLFLPFLNGKT